MTDTFTEAGVEQKVLNYLDRIGWDTYGDPEAERGWGSLVLDERYDRDRSDVVYWNLLKEQMVEINDQIDAFDAGDVVEKLRRRIDTEQLLEGNRSFYNLLRTGIRHTPDGEEDADFVQLVDWAEDVPPERRDEAFVERNRLMAATQFQVQRKSDIRPDLVLFLNGIPIVPMELKSTAEDTTVRDGIRDMKQYEEKEPRLFVPALLNAVCNGETFRYAAVGAGASFYFPWRSEAASEAESYYEPEDAVTALLAPGTLRDILRYFVFYENNEAKIVPRHMQYQAANRIIERIRNGAPKKGLIWHTQGSGKSYTMLFAAHKAKRLKDLQDAQYVLIVDRKKLNEQMKDTLHSIDFPSFATAEGIEHLEELLAEEKAQLILTTIQKFEDTDAKVNEDVEFPTVVMVDEAHRFMEAKLGNRLKSALAGGYFYFGFTGTPVQEGHSEQDRNTFREFSPEGEGYLHRYSIKDGQRDKIITRVSFRRATVTWDISEEALEEMDLEYEHTFEDLDADERQEILRKYVNRTELAELRPRLRTVVRDIQSHFRTNVEPSGFKGMVVTPSRRAAALYGDELMQYFDPEEICVVISTESGDDPVIQRHHLSPHDERQMIKDFKDPEKNPKLLVVCDKLLTGFDAPILKTMYLDKPLRNHNLLQAIARTNRQMEGKENGEIVDYQGVFEDIESVLQYDDVVIETAVVPTDELVEEFMDRLDQLVDLFDEFELSNDPEQFKRIIEKLEKNKAFARTFENKYEEAQELWETLVPHEALGRDEVEEKWAFLTQVFSRYRRTERGGKGALGDDVRAKTREILEKYMDVEDVDHEEEQTYDLPEREVQMGVSEETTGYGFILRAINIRDSIKAQERQNPLFETLSERVQQIIEGWRNDEISVTEAKDKLNDVEDEQDELEEERNEKELDDEGFAVYKLLTNDYSEHVDTDREARDLADAIDQETKDHTVGGNLSEVKKQMEATVITVLADKGYVDLCKGEHRQFVTEAVNYIVENRRAQTDADD